MVKDQVKFINGQERTLYNVIISPQWNCYEGFLDEALRFPINMPMSSVLYVERVWND